MEPVIIREYFPKGTNGSLFINGTEICKTIELPWKENETGISCIPEGKYELLRRYSPRFGRHIIIKDVAHRELILFHPANDALKELRGCIAPVSKLTGIGRGEKSKIAMEKLVAIIYRKLNSGETVFVQITSRKPH